MVQVRKESLQDACEKVTNGEDLHICGQPGIGKTEFRKNLLELLPDSWIIKSHTIRLHHTQEDLEEDLLVSARNAATQHNRWRNQYTSFSFGLGSIVSVGASKDDQESAIHKLKKITNRLSGSRLILCVEDIHKLDENDKIVRDIIADISAHLGEDAQLITVGQISGINIDTEIELDVYSLNQTKRFLSKKFGDLSDETIRQLHLDSEGHPIVLNSYSPTDIDGQELSFSKNKMYNSIEERYIESLPEDLHEFLLEVAPLPELDEKTCSTVVNDISRSEADQLLRRLNRRAIIQKVKWTDDDVALYKLHEHFRQFLLNKNDDIRQTNRKALEYHIRELTPKLTQQGREGITSSIPHAFYINHHLMNIHGEDFGPEDTLREIDQIEVRYPKRGVLVFYLGTVIHRDDTTELFHQEYPKFCDWINKKVDNETQAELVTNHIKWFLSQMKDEDPLELSDIKIDGSLDDLPEESHPLANLDFSKRDQTRLHISRYYLFQYFLTEEPYEKERHRKHTAKVLNSYGISWPVLIEFKRSVTSVLESHELGEEFANFIDDTTESVSQEFSDNLRSKTDYYDIRDELKDLSQEGVETFHFEILLDSGLVEEVAIEGGKSLENADNPGIAMIWYGFFISYLQNTHPDSTSVNRIKNRFRTQMKKRQEYEEYLENPIVKVEEKAMEIVMESECD